MWKIVVVLLILALLSVTPQGAAIAQDADLEERVSRLESRVRDDVSVGVVFFLFGAFCALWAQNTGRSPWSWFFLGLFFNVVTVVVLLAKNSGDRARQAGT